MEAFWLSTVVIFIAELGDKSQLMALAFATRYRAWIVLTGITVATAVVHAFSVLLGGLAGLALPTRAIQVAAALAFFGFAWWTWRGDELTAEDEARAARPARSALLAVAGTFFLAELGDKTMLATVTLAADNDVFGVWLGSTVGMVAADALAILLGRLLGTNLPERTVRIVAVVAFVAFGVLLLVEALRGG
ncbi:MAG: TMEM165/GDT1 family protein [Candidatus Nanopelagicales bacterium]